MPFLYYNLEFQSTISVYILKRTIELCIILKSNQTKIGIVCLILMSKSQLTIVNANCHPPTLFIHVYHINKDHFKTFRYTTVLEQCILRRVEAAIPPVTYHYSNIWIRFHIDD